MRLHSMLSWPARNSSRPQGNYWKVHRSALSTIFPSKSLEILDPSTVKIAELYHGIEAYTYEFEL